MNDWPKYYILVDRTPFAVDLLTWGKQFRICRVAEDWIGKARVSTVFLGLNHNYGNGEPLLFETMVFGGPMNEQQWRYSTYAEAERGHVEVVASVKKDQIKSIMDAHEHP